MNALREAIALQRCAIWLRDVFNRLIALQA